MFMHLALKLTVLLDDDESIIFIFCAECHCKFLNFRDHIGLLPL